MPLDYYIVTTVYYLFIYGGIIVMSGVCCGFILFVLPRLRRNSLQPRCRKCRYILDPTYQNQCPECGWQPTAQDSLTGMSRIWVFLTLLLIVSFSSAIFFALYYQTFNLYDEGRYGIEGDQFPPTPQRQIVDFRHSVYTQWWPFSEFHAQRNYLVTNLDLTVASKTPNSNIYDTVIRHTFYLSTDASLADPQQPDLGRAIEQFLIDSGLTLQQANLKAQEITTRMNHAYRAIRAQPLASWKIVSHDIDIPGYGPPDQIEQKMVDNTRRWELIWFSVCVTLTLLWLFTTAFLAYRELSKEGGPTVNLWLIKIGGQHNQP